MNPYLIIGMLLAWGASVGYAGWLGIDYGKSSEIAHEKKVDDVAKASYDGAQKAAAEAIAKIKPRNVTIQNEVQREVQTNTVYRDCHVTPDGMRLANSALTGQPQPAGDSKLPGADGAAGRLDGRPAGQAGGGGGAVPRVPASGAGLSP